MSSIIKTQNVTIKKTNSNSSSSSSSKSSNNNMMEERYYEAIIFSGPIVFTLIILFLLYFFYLRRNSVDWSSLRMRQSHVNSTSAVSLDPDLVVSEVGLKKEFRELLPIIIYKESFSVKDALCSVCLGDYQAEDRLQQIPGCGHTFHLYCIDLWLATHTTCPLCRLSLVSPSKEPPQPLDLDSLSESGSSVNSIQIIDGILIQHVL